MMTRATGAAILALVFGSCANDGWELVDPPGLAPPIPPPIWSTAPFDDLTLEVGDSVVVQSVEALFFSHAAWLTFTASSSDTTVFRASVSEFVRLTITARALGSAYVRLTATEPSRHPDDTAGLGPHGRSITRTAKVTVIEP